MTTEQLLEALYEFNKHKHNSIDLATLCSSMEVDAVVQLSQREYIDVEDFTDEFA